MIESPVQNPVQTTREKFKASPVLRNCQNVALVEHLLWFSVSNGLEIYGKFLIAKILIS